MIRFLLLSYDGLHPVDRERVCVQLPALDAIASDERRLAATRPDKTWRETTAWLCEVLRQLMLALPSHEGRAERWELPVYDSPWLPLLLFRPELELWNVCAEVPLSDVLSWLRIDPVSFAERCPPGVVGPPHYSERPGPEGEDSATLKRCCYVMRLDSHAPWTDLTLVQQSDVHLFVNRCVLAVAAQQSRQCYTARPQHVDVQLKVMQALVACVSRQTWSVSMRRIKDCQVGTREQSSLLDAMFGLPQDSFKSFRWGYRVAKKFGGTSVLIEVPIESADHGFSLDRGDLLHLKRLAE